MRVQRVAAKGGPKMAAVYVLRNRGDGANHRRSATPKIRDLHSVRAAATLILGASGGVTAVTVTVEDAADRHRAVAIKGIRRRTD